MEKELDINALGEKIKQYCIARGYSAQRLSNITGVSKSHINNIESANSHASAEVLVRIANALEISVDILLCDARRVYRKRDKNNCRYSESIERKFKTSRSKIGNVNKGCTYRHVMLLG